MLVVFFPPFLANFIYSRKFCVYFHVGHVLQIKPAEYLQMISSMRPNIWAALADEVPAWVSDKRNKTSVDRTIKWLDECIELSPVKTYMCSFWL